MCIEESQWIPGKHFFIVGLVELEQCFFSMCLSAALCFDAIYGEEKTFNGKNAGHW